VAGRGRGFKVANCDLEELLSSAVSWNMKSAGKRLRLRRTCSLKRFVVTPQHCKCLPCVFTEHGAIMATRVDPPSSSLLYFRAYLTVATAILVAYESVFILRNGGPLI
jgi:hypothetical protein